MLPQVLLSQTKRPWTVFPFGGFHIPTEYTTDTGPATFKDKTARSLGMQSEKILYTWDQWSLLLGINGRIYLANTPWLMGIEYNDEIYNEYPITLETKDLGYLWTFDQAVLEFPIGGKYSVPLKQPYSLESSLKLIPALYYETVDYTATLFQEYPEETREFYEVYNMYREYDDFNDRAIEISSPKLEFQVDLRVKRELNTYGAVLIGGLYRIGTTRLSTSRMVAHDFIPEIRSTGHFERNMNFYALELGFEFGKHARKQ